MPTYESPVTIAERHVALGERRVVRQKELIEKLVRDNHPATASQARAVLALLEESLRLAREVLVLEIKHYGNPGKEG
jgi:DNA-binding ferritin-like protein